MSESPNTAGFAEKKPQAIVRGLRQTPEEFARLFAQESKKVLQHRWDDEWSAVEIVWHLADHDAFERSQRFEAVLVEENPVLPDDDTRFRVEPANRWGLSAAETLAFFRRERNLTVALLERLGPNDGVWTGVHLGRQADVTSTRRFAPPRP